MESVLLLIILTLKYHFSRLGGHQEPWTVGEGSNLICSEKNLRIVPEHFLGLVGSVFSLVPTTVYLGFLFPLN